MNLNDKFQAKIERAAERFLERVAAGEPEAALREEFAAKVEIWLLDHGVEIGPKFLEIIVGGAIGAAIMARGARKEHST